MVEYWFSKDIIHFIIIFKRIICIGTTDEYFLTHYSSIPLLQHSNMDIHVLYLVKENYEERHHVGGKHCYSGSPAA